MIVTSKFKPAWWLKNPHLQTMYSFFLHPKPKLCVRIERLELPDRDFVDLVWLDEGLPIDAPVIILLHGLCGSGNSKHIRTQMFLYQQMGWRSVVLQCRGVSSEPNRILHSYHAGDTKDLNHFLQVLAEREPLTKKGIIGISLGGNVLLKWLGEIGHQDLITVAVAVSTPFQLNTVADRMNRGFSRVYRNFLLRNLRSYFMRKLQSNPNEALYQAVKSSHCFWTFDENVTAPWCGFDGVHSYYHESSSRAYLHKIATPTLILHAVDDPFMIPEAVPTLAELSPSVTLELSEYGGHLGFVSGNIPGKPEYWLDKRIPDFFANYMN